MMISKTFKLKRFYEFSTSSTYMVGKLRNSNKLEFSGEEESKILNVLNEESGAGLTKLRIPPSQINKFDLWKKKKGTFNTIQDVIDVEGMDVKSIAKICKSIVIDEPIKLERISISKNRQNVSPSLPHKIEETLTSAVGLHLGPTKISWAKLNCPERVLEVWGFKNFPHHPPKATSIENFELAMSVLNDIPVGDLYVIESIPGLSMQNQAQLVPVMTFIQQIELNAILLALLNTSTKHNQFVRSTDTKSIQNTVYYMKSKLPARLFQTWVGNEKVAAISAMKELFNKSEFNLPCTPIEIDGSLREKYEDQSSIDKELMCQSLFLTMAFLDLCVYKNPQSLKAISPSKRNR